ncbi:MAG: hypothetical protein JO236_06275 [Mycobacterium sp.]|uniref:hypothetical protein n=1 Tax=Mycobacterium sp. TaxID=1785 RepID=UPI001ED2F41B|nr:hypothetical protein [Mycobacterium sp.]MBW0017135.1 hypothetical protein [Mycobacterium sp.]
MHRVLSAALCTVAAVAALALSACSNHVAKNSAATESVPPASSSEVANAPTVPLPAPEALVDVLTRLSDPAVPGANKTDLVQGATPETGAVLDKYTNALRDNGYLPMTFTAEGIAWSDQNASNVMATINVSSANNRRFTFPMDFTPCATCQGSWQLSRKTAEMLLALGTSPDSTTPATSSAPAPPPGPNPSPSPSASQPAPVPAPTESPAPAPAPTS